MPPDERAREVALHVLLTLDNNPRRAFQEDVLTKALEEYAHEREAAAWVRGMEAAASLLELEPVHRWYRPAYSDAAIAIRRSAAAVAALPGPE